MKVAISILLVLAALTTQAGQTDEADQVLYFRGHELWEQGQQKEALMVFKNLIKRYPTSKFVPDAYLFFGEYYFDNAKLQKALMAYKKVAEYKSSETYPYALYKMGWCYYNIQEFDRALEKFVTVVKHFEKEERALGRKIKLRHEALNDIVLAYSHAGKANVAPAFFKRLAPKEAGKLLAKLAKMYYGHAKLEDAVFLYQHLLAQEQCSPAELVYQKKIVDCIIQTDNKIKTIQETGRLVVLFGQVEKCLLNPTTRQQKTLYQVRNETEKTLYTLAVSFRKEAEATKDPETFRHSTTLAEYYLELFSGNPRANEIRTLLH